MKQLRLFHLLSLVVLLSASMAFAQTDTGRVIGSVTDPSGAIIPGATVTIKNQATASTRTLQVGADGNFSVSALPAGRYHLEAKQNGFKTATADVVLEVSQVQQVPFHLQTGSAETVVNVTDEVPLVETSTSSTGEVIQGRQVSELPLNGRNFTQLALLTPGVTRGAYGDVSMGGTSGTGSESFRNSETGGASISANGQRQQANNFLLDGVDNNEALVNSIVFFPPAEAIQEFRVNTSVAPAEFGRAGGAIIQTSIKSGTNSYHGSAFWFRRSGEFDAHPYGATGPIDFKRNQFGGQIGGALWKDRIFGFGDYQGLRQSQPQNVEFATVPTAKMRTGDFSELLGSGLTSTPSCYTGAPINGAIFNPATCTPYAGNIITNANAAGLAYLQAFPLPNLTGTIEQNFKAQRQAIRNFNDFDVRFDFILTQKDSVFARYSYGQDGFTVTDRLKDATHDLPSGFGSGDNFSHPRGVAVGETHTFGANLVNEFRFGYSRPAFGYNPPFQGVPLAEQLGITNANRSPLLGGIALIGGNNSEIEYTGDFGPYNVPEHTYQFLDSLSHNLGRHSLKYGANILKRQVDFFQGNAAKGYFILGGVNFPGTGRFTGYEMSELLSGFSDYRIGPGAQFFKTRNWETGYFAQDDWRVNRRLTLNLGLRYDLYTWPTEVNNQQANFDPATGQLVLAGTNGWGDSLINTDKNNFAPRIGFAYDLKGTGKTVLRGGYGMFYFLDRGGIGNQLSNNPGFNGVFEFQACPTASVPGGPQCPGGFRPTFTGQGPLGNNDPTLATAPLPLPAVAFTPAPANGSLIYYPRDNQNSKVQQWNVQVEQQLGTSMALNIAYVGTYMSNLATSYNVNNVPLNSLTGARAFPLYGAINAFANIGSGNYNGLQTSLNRRFSKGLQFTTAYTYSHTLDNSNGGFSNNNNTIFVDQNGTPLLDLNYGSSDSDIRHAFVGSVLYELPFGRGHQYGADIPKALDLIIGGWQWNNILTLQSGTPINLNVNGTPNNRPDLVGGDPQLSRVGNNWNIEGATFAAPPTNVAGNFTRAGTFGRNGLVGPAYHTWDMSMFKNFNITERFVAQFRCEGFNILNTPQFTNPTTNGTVPGISGTPATLHTGFNNGVSTRFSSERQLQFALRVTF
jgi:hypothetical protein